MGVSAETKETLNKRGSTVTCKLPAGPSPHMSCTVSSDAKMHCAAN